MYLTCLDATLFFLFIFPFVLLFLILVLFFFVLVPFLLFRVEFLFQLFLLFRHSVFSHLVDCYRHSRPSNRWIRRFFGPIWQLTVVHAFLIQQM